MLEIKALRNRYPYFLFSFVIFQSLMTEDGDQITFKFPLLPQRGGCTEKDVHLQLNPLPLSFFVRIAANPSLLCGADIL